VLGAGLIKDVHTLSDITFVVVHVVIAPIPSLSNLLNHIVLSLVINFLKMPKFKDVISRIGGAGSSTATSVVLLFLGHTNVSQNTFLGLYTGSYIADGMRMTVSSPGPDATETRPHLGVFCISDHNLILHSYGDTGN
jgi:hypothetical protein